MKNKFIITVSDIHGVKQYTLHQFIKTFIIWLVIAVIVILAVGSLILYSLSNKVDTLNSLSATLQNTQLVLEEKNSNLQTQITRKSQALDSMNDHLEEIESIIGLEPDADATFVDRAAKAREKSAKKLEASRVTVAQLAILNRSIPNGSPIHYNRISDEFGYRVHPITKKYHLHSGIDLSAESGTPIYAPADGVVEYAQPKGQYGNYLHINHPYGFKTVYGHLQKFAVQSGDYVLKGDVVGYVGNTGRSTGPHLHYEIRYLHKWLNPKKFMTWSSNTYGNVIASEKQVNWKELLLQIEQRLQVQSHYAINSTRNNYGNIQKH